MDAGSALLVHTALEMAAIGAGARLYALSLHRHGHGSLTHGSGFVVALGCILGAIVGSKLAVWLEYPHLVRQYWGSPLLVLTGQSIVGGLIGGLAGVEIAKKIAGVRHATGDDFVLPLVVGIAVGRIGCFLAGLHDDTYGVATEVPWGVDFGDGVKRHPTQLYDIALVLALGIFLTRAQRWLSAEPGLQFKLFLAGYLAWRVVIDSFKPVPYFYFGALSGIQLLAAAFLCGYVPLVVRQMRRLA
jgi:phosphatidylglycerol---prolipoprotein diacylglyceryl transferase